MRRTFRTLRISTGLLVTCIAVSVFGVSGPAEGVAPNGDPAGETATQTPVPPADALPKPKTPAKDKDGYAKGMIVSIKGEISDVTFKSLERRVAYAREHGAEIIIFEIDTPGGMVSSALDICDMIKHLQDIKTVAWVHTDAYSAGSMIAMACDEIVMSVASTIGDCGVILGGPTGPEEVPEALRAKAESPVIEQFRDSASRNGYNQLLCESLVVKERVVYWIENTETGERRFVDPEEMQDLVGTRAKDSDEDEGEAEEPVSELEERPAARRVSEWRLVESYIDPISDRPIPIQQPVVSETELLTMSQSKATAFGFCKAIVSDTQQLEARYNIAEPLMRSESNWSENFTGWLTSMPVRMFLLIIIFLGVYVEFNTPGVGVPGAVALLCLGIFVGAPYLTGLANVWELVIILIGFALLAVEIFVIPGFGIAGLAGIICVIVGILATFIPDEPGRSFPIYWPKFEPGLEGLKIGVMTLASASVASVVAMIIFSRLLPKVPWLQGAMPLNPELEAAEEADPYHGYARAGDVGTTETPLRPSGKARFGGELVDVVTEGDFLDPRTDVIVVERRGNRVVVRRFG